MQINLNTPGAAATSTISTVAPAAQTKTTITTAPSTADTVTLSAEAKAKLAADLEAGTLGSGSGNEPPITKSLSNETPLVQTLGSGSGNEPPIDDEEDKEK
ncbi:MAG: hypothetical protein K2W88_07750 [Pararheinheimera sp.]|nr:hypothetical protein [Rheinheimera sp.]